MDGVPPGRKERRERNAVNSCESAQTRPFVLNQIKVWYGAGREGNRCMVQGKCFDKLVPEGRHAPWKYLPRPGARLSVTSGTPVPPAVVQEEERRRNDTEVRIALTDAVQRAVEALGRQASRIY
ncbi:hypothetical protein EDB85DRAFT_1896251 [Lactarius pseudohatsudake]|nr:hypothetical protein EDB85DRAFT_1896251 [Lactarius pseudohatsudake]